MHNTIGDGRFSQFPGNKYNRHCTHTLKYHQSLPHTCIHVCMHEHLISILLSMNGYYQLLPVTTEYPPSFVFSHYKASKEGVVLAFYGIVNYYIT